MKIKRIISLSLTAALLISASGFVLAQYGGRNLPSFAALVRDNQAAVVNVAAIQQTDQDNQGNLRRHFDGYFRRFERPEAPLPRNRQESLGSGFIISDDGYVLTNSHVVKNADKVVVRLSDRREYVAKVVGTDSRSDIALLKIDAKNLPSVRIGRSKDIEVGEWVLAIGSPFGFDHSVTAGIVSALQRSLPTAQNENYVPFIQTDVAINPGNSGGPLLNLEGEVIGVNAQIYTRTGSYIGVSFAIPIDVVMEVVAQLKGAGKVSRGWLGVAIQEVNLDLAQSFGLSRPQGALVSQVVPDSPAAAGGIRSGDIIVKLNDQPIMRSGELPHLVGRIRPGTQVNLDVIRNKSKIRLKVALGELPSRRESLLGGPESDRQSDDATGLHSTELGIRLTAVPANLENLIEQAGFDSGVYVEQVRPGTAADAGIQPSDVLVSINNQKIRSPEDFERILNTLSVGTIVPVRIVRRNGQFYVALRIGAADTRK